MHPYGINKDQLIKLGYGRNEIFDFLADKDRDLFERLFTFAHINLTDKWPQYKIHPGIFFYYNDDELNAYAQRVKDHSIIAINKGLISKLYEFFEKADPTYNKIVKDLFPDLPGKLDVPLFFLVFQLTMLFTYYHEHGHLIQLSEARLSLIKERKQLIAGDQFDQKLHAMEIDADMHAAHLITFHIIEYWKKLPKEFQTKENIENLLSLIVSGIFVFFFFLTDGITDMYYLNYTHPHEIIRISYLVDGIVGVVEQNLPELGKLDSKRALQNSFKITDEVLEAGMGIQISKFVEPFWKERGEIGKYLAEMLQFMGGLPFLIRNKKDPYKD